jgi:hypothetical protein
MVADPWTAMLLAWMPWCFMYGVFYLVFVVPPLFFVRARALDETTRALWALAIISVPIMGAIAFVILRPGQGEG